MSKFTGNLTRKFNSFCHLAFESIANNLSEERESENAQNVAEMDEANIVEVGDTSNSPPKFMSVLQNVPTSSEIVMSGEIQKDHVLWLRRIV